MVFFKKIFFLIVSLFFLLGLSTLLFLWQLDFFTALKTQNYLLLEVDQNKAKSQGYLLRVEESPQKKMQLFMLNSQASKELIAGYGEYEFSAIWPLLNLEKKSLAFKKAIFSHDLGLVIDELVVLHPGVLSSISSKREFSGRAWSLGLFSRNLDLKSRLQLLKIATKLNPYVFEVSTDQEVNIIEDGSTCTLAVVNTTQTNGLGASFAKILEKNSYRVVNIADSQTVLPESILFWTKKDEACLQLSDRLKNLIPSNRVEEDETLFGQYRADLVFFLGEDLVTN